MLQANRFVKELMVYGSLVLASAGVCELMPRAEISAIQKLSAPNLRELSGMVWSTTWNALVAVSDRGSAWTIQLDNKGLASIASSDLNISSCADRSINAESLAIQWLKNGAEVFHIVNESKHLIHTVLPASSHCISRPLPATGRISKDGIESIEWHPEHGILTLAQRPAAGEHVVVAESGRRWRIATKSSLSVSAKGMHLHHSNVLIILEKAGRTGDHETRIRLVNLTKCGGEVVCESNVFALIDLQQIEQDDNFEGIACTPKLLCYVVSDDGHLATSRTRLVTFELPLSASSSYLN